MMGPGENLPSDADIRFFEENGYWIGGKILSDAEIADLHGAMDDVYAGRFETGRPPHIGGWRERGIAGEIRKTDNAYWANSTIRNLAFHPTIGAMAARLMNTREVRLWHDQLLYKPGQNAAASSTNAGNVGWHQDYGYWQCTCPDLITAWVALVDVDVTNGCMQFVPGSHRWGLLPESDFFNTDLETVRATVESRTGKKWAMEPCVMKAGQVSFHHCLTIHGSGPNLTSDPRRSLVIHLMPEHAAYIADTPNDNHMNALFMKERGGRDGDRFDGDEWPVVYRTE